MGVGTGRGGRGQLLLQQNHLIFIITTSVTLSWTSTGSPINSEGKCHDSMTALGEEGGVAGGGRQPSAAPTNRYRVAAAERSVAAKTQQPAGIPCGARLRSPPPPPWLLQEITTDPSG